MRARHKHWTKPYIEEHPELFLPQIDATSAFFTFSPLYLEIGMGKGDFILGMSHLQKGHYLGIEKVEDVIAVAGKKIKEDENEDILLREGDFDSVYEEIKTLRFDRIYLNFSDPWPKKKHEKRRLSEVHRLNKMASILKEDGLLILKSDNDAFFAYTLEQVALSDFKIDLQESDYQFDQEHDIQSEYEKNFRSNGKNINRLILSKKEK